MFARVSRGGACLVSVAMLVGMALLAPAKLEAVDGCKICKSGIEGGCEYSDEHEAWASAVASHIGGDSHPCNNSGGTASCSAHGHLSPYFFKS